MLKKHFISVLLMVLMIVGANAGTWKMHTSYVTSKIQNIYDTGDKVYYLNSGTLFQFDKATQNTVTLGRQNILSDNSISQIYYDWENNLLFVAYLNSNIDVINGDGKVTNISSIKNLVLPPNTYTLEDGKLASTVSKAINDITFSNGYAYVAVGYGYVKIDETTLRVVKNYDMGKTITIYSAGGVGTDMMVVLSAKYCYYGSVNAEDPRNEFPRASGSFTNVKTYPINDHSFFAYTASALYQIDLSSGAPVRTTILSEGVANVQKTPTGFIANCPGKAYFYTIDPAGTTTTKVTGITGYNYASSNPNGDGSVWVCDANGLHIYGSEAYYKLNGMTTDIAYWMKYNTYMDKLYVGVSAPNKVYSFGSDVKNVINTYDGTTWENATAYAAEGAGYDFVFNPLDSTTYMRGGWNNMVKVTNNVLKLTYNTTNSPFASKRPTPAFDNYGNMWVVSSYGSASTNNPVMVLTKDKVAKNTVSKSSWFIPSGLLALHTGQFQRARFLVSKKNNVKIYSSCDYFDKPHGRIYCWDNGNEDPLVDNYQLVEFSNFIDQYSKKVDWVYLCHFEEDNEGLIWIGHTLGLFVLDPATVFDDNPVVVRPYVAKSKEGKGYLCEGFSVFDVGVDRDNNKWIASNNGLYYVSPDGSELYNHFTTENSDIPSNSVYGVECDPEHDRVYIVTDNGFAEYIVNGEAAALNLDNVYAFPNPVEPDFTGMIKIANLMDNCYVTITDRTGAIVAQMGPVTGSALWDGCGSDGERLPTGVYNVYAAQGAQPQLTGTPQTTIMIIK